MSCLRVDQIYLYLEEELAPMERQQVEGHLSSCPRCREAVAARAHLAEAAGTLPDLEIPGDFSSRVMSRIFAAKFSLRGLLMTLAVGFSLLGTTLGLLLVVTGQNLPGLFLSLIHYLLNNLKSLALPIIKFFKLSFLGVKILFHLLEELWSSLSVLTGIISPQMQIAIVLLTLFLCTTLFFIVRKRFFLGENHEN